MANLTPLFTGLSRGLSGYRQGQREREDRDAERQQREMRDMLAIYGEGRAREGHELNQRLGMARLSGLEREQGWESDPTTHPKYKAYLDAGMPPERARAAVLTPTLADDFFRPPPASPRPLVRDEIRARVQELTNGGMSLDAANAQARQEFGYTNPRPPTQGSSTISDARRNLPIYERRVSEEEGNVTAAEKAAPKRPTFGFASPEQEPKFLADSTASADRYAAALATLRQARTARDSVAAEVTNQPRQGRSPERTDVPQPKQPPIDRAAMQREFDSAAARYKRLLAAGADPDEARRAYGQTLEAIARKHGAIP